MYRGRLAPSPTGFLHTGHARTFWTAQERAQGAGGVLVLRNEDLDAKRSRPGFADAVLEDLRWFGFRWQEGPDCGGPFAPYTQSQRHDLYRAAFEKLRAGGWIYPCHCSRQEVLRSLQAPHLDTEEPIYPGTCRPKVKRQSALHDLQPANWRFQVPDGEKISFEDGFFGSQVFESGKDFGDFVVWRQDDLPSYQLAVVVDDALMKITEVVRGADLLLSTARQLLLYRALGHAPPGFFHCPLVLDDSGMRLAKRHESLSLRNLRASGITPEMIRHSWEAPQAASKIV